MVGKVTMERVNLQEGVDDAYVCSPAIRHRENNEMHWRNYHLSGFSLIMMIQVLDSTM